MSDNPPFTFERAMGLLPILIMTLGMCVIGIVFNEGRPTAVVWIGGTVVLAAIVVIIVGRIREWPTYLPSPPLRTEGRLPEWRTIIVPPREDGRPSLTSPEATISFFTGRDKLERDVGSDVLRQWVEGLKHTFDDTVKVRSPFAALIRCTLQLNTQPQFEVSVEFGGDTRNDMGLTEAQLDGLAAVPAPHVSSAESQRLMIVLNSERPKRRRWWSRN